MCDVQACSLATTIGHMKKHDESQALFDETLKTMRRVLGNDHPLTQGTIKNQIGIQLRSF